PQGVHVIDDAYNANPGSVQAALGTLADLSGQARRFAALGDMLELGPEAAALHHAVGLHAGRSGVATVFALGQWAEDTARGARAGGCEAAAFTDIKALQAAVGQTLRPGDWLLVKGSRGMRMERLVSSVVKGEV
ncbi:MAG: UDP-N-acetylmuramoyl-tripeptide--D-alanyl-D-alanine ligase, partial [Cytophagaceae bacterium]